MSLKSWVLDRVHRMNGAVTRSDLPPREPSLAPARKADIDVPAHAGHPQARAHEPGLALAEHLGAYAPLIAAIRDELEHFIASQLRLHLAIAERDRFLLTAIAVDCPEQDETRQQFLQFMREFKPEQVKRYLVREVIAGLPNASAIDLSQFAGLADASAQAIDGDDDGEYRELLAALRTTPNPAALRPYKVSVIGRWAELDGAQTGAGTLKAVPTTPLAGQRVEFDIEDGDGRRRAVLQSVVPGRRYVIGKDEASDIRVNGVYASRRHAEIWIESGAWWAADAGSTNGVRIESKQAPARISGPATPGEPIEPVRLAPGARMRLSAHADGPPGEYPWIALHPGTGEATRPTPIAARSGSAAPKTPLTAILPAHGSAKVLKVTAIQAGGVRTLELHAGSMPVTVGRSRNQTLVVDRRHDGVSGHHLDIVELDESGAQVVVHGDNGVLIEGVAHPSGARVRWKTGETMVLGDSVPDHPACTLMLARAGRE